MPRRRRKRKRGMSTPQHVVTESKFINEQKFWKTTSTRKTQHITRATIVIHSSPPPVIPVIYTHTYISQEKETERDVAQPEVSVMDHSPQLDCGMSPMLHPCRMPVSVTARPKLAAELVTVPWKGVSWPLTMAKLDGGKVTDQCWLIVNFLLFFLFISSWYYNSRKQKAGEGG